MREMKNTISEEYHIWHSDNIIIQCNYQDMELFI